MVSDPALILIGARTEGGRPDEILTPEPSVTKPLAKFVAVTIPPLKFIGKLFSAFELLLRPVPVLTVETLFSTTALFVKFSVPPLMVTPFPAIKTPADPSVPFEAMTASLEAVIVPPLIIKVEPAKIEVPNISSAVRGEQVTGLSMIILPLVILNVVPDDRVGPDAVVWQAIPLLLLVTVPPAPPEMVNVPPAAIERLFCTMLPLLKVILAPGAKKLLLISVPAPPATVKEEKGGVRTASNRFPVKVKDPAVTVVVKV